MGEKTSLPEVWKNESWHEIGIFTKACLVKYLAHLKDEYELQLRTEIDTSQYLLLSGALGTGEPGNPFDRIAYLRLYSEDEVPTDASYQFTLSYLISGEKFPEYGKNQLDIAYNLQSQELKVSQEPTVHGNQPDEYYEELLGVSLQLLVDRGIPDIPD
jgi:hypothetical protein